MSSHKYKIIPSFKYSHWPPAFILLHTLLKWNGHCSTSIPHQSVAAQRARPRLLFVCWWCSASFTVTFTVPSHIESQECAERSITQERGRPGMQLDWYWQVQLHWLSFCMFYCSHLHVCVPHSLPLCYLHVSPSVSVFLRLASTTVFVNLLCLAGKEL